MTLLWMDARRCDPGFTELDLDEQSDICALCPVTAECALWLGTKPLKTPIAARPKLGKSRHGRISTDTNRKKAGAE